MEKQISNHHILNERRGYIGVSWRMHSMALKMANINTLEKRLEIVFLILRGSPDCEITNGAFLPHADVT